MSSSITDDISAGGVSFTTHNNFIAPLTNLMLEFNILSRFINPIGRIAWSNPVAHSDKYRVGVEFVEISDSEKSYLNDFVEMQRGKL